MKNNLYINNFSNILPVLVLLKKNSKRENSARGLKVDSKTMWLIGFSFLFFFLVDRGQIDGRPNSLTIFQNHLKG